MARVTEFVIDRRHWYRGKGSNESCLLRVDDGQMCCLGFYSLACGLKREDIVDECMPNSLKDDLPGEMEWLIAEAGSGNPRHIEDIIAGINDDRELPDESREAHIAAHFLTQGIEVTFIN